MPIFIFFAQGFEHSVVNMFIIPTGMMMGAKVTVARMVAVESDPGHARQSGRRLHLHRARALLTYKPRSATGASLPAPTPGAGGMTRRAEDRRPTPETHAGDFDPEQKRYLEGFVAGLQIAKTRASGGVGLRRGAATRRSRSRSGPTPPRCARRTGSSKPAASCPTRRSSSASSIRSTATSG